MDFNAESEKINYFLLQLKKFYICNLFYKLKKEAALINQFDLIFVAALKSPTE